MDLTSYFLPQPQKDHELPSYQQQPESGYKTVAQFLSDKDSRAMEDFESAMDTPMADHDEEEVMQEMQRGGGGQMQQLSEFTGQESENSQVYHKNVDLEFVRTRLAGVKNLCTLVRPSKVTELNCLSNYLELSLPA